MGFVIRAVVSDGTTYGHSAWDVAAVPPAIEGGDASTADPVVARVLRHGAEEVLLSINSYGSGRASNMPKPPRTAVLPLRNGSQAKPIRGSKFFVVGLCVQKEDLNTEVGSPGTEAAKLGCGHAPGVTGPHGRDVYGDGMIAILPLISVGM